MARAADEQEGGALAQRLTQLRLSGFPIVVFGLIVVALVVLAPGLRTLIEQRQQIARLEQQVEDAQGAVDDLNGEIARWSDPSYVEAQARDRLFYVFPGDTSYLVIGDDRGTTADAGAPTVSDEIQPAEVDWLHALLGTVYAAGLTDATPDVLESPAQTGDSGAGQ